MKNIIADFLRRWWWCYLILFFLVTLCTAADPRTSAEFVCFLVLPFAFELWRSPVKAMTTLPVSRRTIALSYWSLAVLLPVLLMSAIIALEILLFHSVAISLKNAVVMLFGSLLFVGSFYCYLTSIPPHDKTRDRNDSPQVFCCILCMNMALFASRFFLYAKKHGWIIYLAGLTGLFLTILGYLRAEKLVSGPVGEKRMQPPGKTQKNIPPARVARFGGVFLNIIWIGILMGFLVATWARIFNSSGNALSFFYALALGSVFPVALFGGQLRLWRSLPLSTRQLAAILSLMPLASVLAMLAGLAIVWWIVPGRFLNVFFVFSCTMSMVGAICIASSFAVPFGEADLGWVLAYLFAIVIINIIPYTHWPAAFWWLLGLSLILASYFLNRHWLRSSASYRPRKVF
jgi:hypothetical protein